MTRSDASGDLPGAVRVGVNVPPVIEPGRLRRGPQPGLEIDDELLARPWRRADADVVARAYDDPAISHWHGRRFGSSDHAERWIDETADHWRNERKADWAVVEKATGRVVGRVALSLVPKDGVGEVGYWVLPDARGRAIAARATVSATRWAHRLGIHRVELRHSTANHASSRVAAKAGFRSEGVARQANRHDDGWHDMVVLSHLATDDPADDVD